MDTKSSFTRMGQLLLAIITFTAGAGSAQDFCAAEKPNTNDLRRRIDANELGSYLPIPSPDESGGLRIMWLKTMLNSLIRREFIAENVDKASLIYKLYNYLLWEALLDVTDNNAEIAAAGGAYVNTQELDHTFPNGRPRNRQDIENTISCLILCSEPPMPLWSLLRAEDFQDCLEK